MKNKFVYSILAMASVGLAHSATTVHDGLVAYWNLDGNGDDTASSYVGNTSTVADTVAPGGTAGAASISAAGGLFGGAADFERGTGVDGRLAAANSADLNAAGESITISLWTQFDDNASGNWQAILAKGESTNYRIATQNAGNNNNAGYAGGTSDINSGANVRDGGGIWHHIVAITENGASTRIWVDGVLGATSGGAPTIADVGNLNSGELWIGNNPGNATVNRMWDGLIDDVGIWDRVLTPEEIACISSAGSAGIALGAVPEPTSGLLLGLSGLLVVTRRRR